MKLHELELARKAQQQSDKHFYFDDSGSILYYGRSESDEYVQSHHAVLSYEQCKIIEETDKTMNDFIVVIDPANEGVYTLVNKQIELESFKSATSMLSIVKKKTALTSAYDIKIEYTPADPLVNLIVSINEKLRSNVTKNMDINNFTFKGVGFINLYFTTANDPHFMFDSIKVDLIKLFKEGKQVYKVSSELADCDLFTKKIFDKYEYKVTT
jgi:hypothetical protein